MAKPVANFIFNANGLSVQFTDRSSGIINSWAWDFGFSVASVPQTSSLQNPTPILFPNAGVFSIALTVTNTDGAATFTYPITVSVTPGLNSSIKQMVQYNLPVGLAFDSIGFDQSIRTWQLYLQPAANISDTYVFDETAWPPLYNVLISKLIIMDLVVKAATASMASFIAAAESINSFLSSTTTGTVQVADYTSLINLSYPIVINLIEGNGVSYGPSPSLANGGALVAWLNGLGIGSFAITGGNAISSLGNSVILTSFNVTSNGSGVNGAFTQSNIRVVPFNATVVISGGGSLSSKGTLKSLETGPSKAQWYDPSVFWSTIFKSTASSGTGAGGVLGSIQMEICLYAGRLDVKLPGCTQDNTLVKSFIVAKGRAKNCGPFRSGVPASRGIPPFTTPQSWEDVTW